MNILNKIDRLIKGCKYIFILLILILSMPAFRCLAQPDDDANKIFTSTTSEKARNLYIQSTTYMFEKKYVEMEKLLVKAIKIDSGYVDAYMRLSTVYRELQEPNFEEQVYKDLIRIRPDFPFSFFNYQVLLLSKKKLRENEFNFVKTLNVKLKPDNLPKKEKKTLKISNYQK